MAQIPCEDFFEDPVGIIPARPKRTNPDAIANRHANLTYSMNLSPLPGDEQVGNQMGAWSLGDIPSSHASQIDDDDGNDLILVSIKNRVYKLDRDTFRDEWDFNSFGPIYKQLTIGPIPYSEDGAQGYNLADVKQFLEFQFANSDEPEDGVQSKWRISVGEWEREADTYVTTVRAGGQRMRARVMVQGRAFTVRLEHAANEPIHIPYWQAFWNSFGRRIAQNKVVTD